MTSPIVSPRQVCRGTQSHEPREDRRLSRARGPNEGGDGGSGSGAEERPSYGQIMGKSWENGENLGEILGRMLGYNPVFRWI